tara:strand:+ start:1251 stop:1514 length:264 start_codon:yes stop_codon:yes gene_type:complete
MAGSIPTRVNQTLICVIVTSVLLQVVVPMLTSNVEPLRDLLGMLPGTIEVLDAHAEQQVGGALVVALITFLAAVLAPIICPMLPGGL